jgi:hypothetical protein
MKRLVGPLLIKQNECSGPYFPWIFLKILAKIVKNWKKIKIPIEMDKQD